MRRRPAGVLALVFIAVVGLGVVFVVEALLLGGVVGVQGVPVGLTFDQRVPVWFGQLPLAIAVMAATLRLIRVANAVLAGDPFRPPTLRALRQMAVLIGVGGTLGAILSEQVTDAVIRDVAGVDQFSFTLPLGWVIGGLTASLVAEIVAEGVRRSEPGPGGPPPSAPPPGSYAGPAGPPLG